MAKAPENFAQIFPDHPHRRFRLLVAILAFVLAAGSIVIYQIKQAQDTVPEVESVPRKEQKISDAYWEQVVIDARELKANNPPITDKQWQDTILEARKLTESQKIKK